MKKKNVKCFFNKKRGYIANECRRKQGDAKNGMLKTSEIMNVAKKIEVELFIPGDKSCNIAMHEGS